MPAALQRMHEKDENVKTDVFSAIATYIKLASVGNVSQTDDVPGGLVRMKSNIQGLN